MRCEDCGGEVQGTDAELGAILAGITLCEECMAAMEDEADAYEQERIDAGEPPCNWFERQMIRADVGLPVTAAPPAAAADGQG